MLPGCHITWRQIHNLGENRHPRTHKTLMKMLQAHDNDCIESIKVKRGTTDRTSSNYNVFKNVNRTAMI